MHLPLASLKSSSRLSSPLFALLLVAPLLAGCPSHSDDDDDDGIAILGGGSHSIDSVILTEVASGSSELDTPRDLAFNPESPNDLYVVNHDNTGLTIIFDAASDDADAVAFSSFGSDHFLIDPSSIAFGKDGRFATVHETDELTQGPPPFGTPEDFMGPTLWDSDPDIFDGGHSGHLDMLHNSPLAMGVAWEKDNIFWVFDGYHSSVTRYDFKDDHGPGGTDHTDGVVARFVEGEVDRRANTPSHMEFDHDTDRLYIADTNNHVIRVFDLETGDLSLVAGAFEAGPTSMNDDALSATLNTPHGIDIAPDGSVLIADTYNHQILRVNP